MYKEHPKPRWWRLYAIVPASFALMVLESQLALPGWGHKLAQTCIVLAIVGMIVLWAVSNAEALAWADVERARLASLPGDAELRASMARGIASAQLDEAQPEHSLLPSASWQAQLDLAQWAPERNN